MLVGFRYSWIHVKAIMLVHDTKITSVHYERQHNPEEADALIPNQVLATLEGNDLNLKEGLCV
jgi:hypothetical protein